MGIEDYIEEKGKGSPIVFVHGSFATASTWKNMVSALAANHHCISIKIPGHGGAPEPEDFENPTIETELNIIEQAVKACTNEPIHLVGHSYGGVVALGLALKGSVAINEMTLYEPVAAWVLDVMKDVEKSAIVQTFLTRYRQAVSEKELYACAQVIDFWGGAGSFETLPDFIKEAMSPLVDNNIRHWDICTTIDNQLSDLQALAVPTRLVCGSESNAVAHAISDYLASEIPTSQKHRIKGASHFLVTSHVEECLSALRKPMIANN